MGNEEAVLELVNSLSEVERAARWLDDQLQQTDAPPSVLGKLQVAADEVIANIVNHGLRGAAAGTRPIELLLRRRSGAVELEVVDDGPEFDPTAAPAPPSAASGGTPRLGGAGLPFLRGLMDDIRYVRQGDRNRLVMCVRWTTPTQ